MATIIAPNRNYTGNQGAIGFVNGVATFVTFETQEKEDMVFDLLRGRGFTIIDDEEYAEQMIAKVKSSAKAGTSYTAPTGDDLGLPPVEGEGEGEGEDDPDTDNGELDGESKQESNGGKSNKTGKRPKIKISK